MPTGPPELHEKWCNAGPHEGAGDANAEAYLRSHGYRLTTRYQWVLPKPDHEPTPEECSAINYLIWEWDFDGIAPPDVGRPVPPHGSGP